MNNNDINSYILDNTVNRLQRLILNFVGHMIRNKPVSGHLSFQGTDTVAQFTRSLVSMTVCLFSVGNPKGVMLTHGNIVADFSGFLKATDVSST